LPKALGSFTSLVAVKVAPVERMQIILGVAVIVILLAMAGWFAWQQFRTRQTLRRAPDLDPEERRYLQGQVRRRLLCSALMILLAGLLATSFYLEGPASELVREGEANRERGERPRPTPEQEQFVNIYSAYWAFVLLVLLGVVVLAGMDLMAIRRYGVRQLSRIRADRRAMLEGEVARLRSQRNGHN
jgi:uncharacterized membrane protein YjgN (DUF898 family)